MPYRRVSNADRRRLVDCFQNGEDYVSLAKQLSIKRTTAWSVIKKFLSAGNVEADQRGGGRRPKVDEEMVDFSILLLEAEPCITLRRINDTLREVMPDKPHVSISTLHRSLHLSFISMKQVRNVPVNRNSVQTKTLRKEYATWMLQHGCATHRIYIDESGFNLYISRTRGRSAVGEQATRVVCGQRGRNMTLLLAISDQAAIVYHEISWGGVNKERFSEFVENLCVILGEERACLVMDNAPVHNGIENYINKPVRKLPPYSPFLNPIENCFSKIKNDVKQRLGQIRDTLDDRREAQVHGHTLKSWREHILSSITEMALRTVTQQDICGFYRHSMGFIQRCLAEEDIWES